MQILGSNPGMTEEGDWASVDTSRAAVAALVPEPSPTGRFAGGSGRSSCLNHQTAISRRSIPSRSGSKAAARAAATDGCSTAF
ncbi:hypothetical protein AGR7A_Cc260011 [Agrobacterium deltaense NCPPB 1641]|uniref:Uncharacterized protein n=1 Tax=Agrobacterium deltaense NCPPB 1641 TaxID=1183425 RepID=A0A1S7TP16_9HYPH|nr:hypothetical protein AGR7A_Cc260011 [Agrobacterium deltaense NCPPB 1641]